MRFGRRRMPRSMVLTVPGQQLVTEVEAFLAGDFVECLERSGADVPGWAWLNRIAHGELRTIRSIAEQSACLSARPCDGTSESWQAVSQTLAKELLGLINGDSASLSRIQQVGLIPLESRLIESGTDPVINAVSLLQSTREVIRAAIPKEGQQ